MFGEKRKTGLQPRLGLVMLAALIASFPACSKNVETLSAPYNPLLVVLSSAANDGFEGLRTGEARSLGGAAGRKMFDVRGSEAMIPAFDYCKLIFDVHDRWVHCTRLESIRAQPEFSQLASFVRLSLPRDYREKECSHLKPLCREWRTSDLRAPYVLLFALRGDGGRYITELEVRRPI
jgi:hypothetical protein